MNTRSVGLFVDAYAPIMDGVTLTVRNYAYWLSRFFGPASVITPEVPLSADENEDFPVFRFLSIPTIVKPPYRVGLPELDIKLKKYIKSKSFSLVHAHSPFTTGAAALKIARERGIPIVTTFHSKYREDFLRTLKMKSIVNEQIKRIIDFYYAADHVWVPQESVAKTLREYGYKGPYDVVENGIDMAIPADIGPFRARGEKELGLAASTPMGLFVGQHVLEKNIDFIVRSLPAILAKLPDFKMVFVGQGYAKEQLIEQVHTMGLSGNVIFHELIFDRELLKSIYARADIFLFPSKYDNAPLVVREAAALGTPAVLLEGSTAAEVIRNGENGFLSPENEEAYAQIVVQALADRALLARVSTGAQATLCRSWEHVVREVATRYEAILSRWAE